LKRFRPAGALIKIWVKDHRKPKNGNEMGCVHKKYSSFSCFSFSIRGNISFVRYAFCCQGLLAESFQLSYNWNWVFFKEFSYLDPLRSIPVSSFILLRLLLSLIQGVLWNILPMSQCGIQLAFRTIEVYLFELSNSTFLILSKILPHSIFGYSTKFRYHTMRKSIAFQPQNFHPSLYQRNRMMITP